MAASFLATCATNSQDGPHSRTIRLGYKFLSLTETTAMASFTLDAATLVAVFTSAILYGIFLTLFVASLYILIQKRKTHPPNWILIMATITMFLFSTAFLALSFSRVLDGFITYRDTVGPVAYFEDLSQWKEITRMVLTCLYMLLADSILIWRCWIVWSNNWRVIAFPLILWFGGIAVVISVMSTHPDPNQTLFAGALGRCITAVVSYTLAQNIIVTGLIAFRIWHIDRTVSESRQTSLMPLISALLESGILYVTTLLVYLAVYLAGSNATFVMDDVVNPMIGITFSLLIVRVGLGLTPKDSLLGSKHSHSTSRSLRDVSVTVHRQVHTDAVSDDGTVSYALQDRQTPTEEEKAPGLSYA